MHAWYSSTSIYIYMLKPAAFCVGNCGSCRISHNRSTGP